MFSSMISMPTIKALRALNVSTALNNRSMERLATGKKINRASDDPAGMVAATSLRVKGTVLAKRLEPLDREMYSLAAREGAQSVVGDLVLELQSNVVTAASTAGLSMDERSTLQDQTDNILNTIDFLANTQSFNGQQILTGWNSSNLGRSSVSIGGETLLTSLASLHSGGSLNLISGNFEAAQKMVQGVGSFISGSQAAIGNRMRSIESEVRRIHSEAENTEAARSQIEDTDYASEVSEQVRTQVLKQAAVYMTALSITQNRDDLLSLLAGTIAPKAKPSAL